MSDDAVLYEKKDGVAIMTINRPERMNALPSYSWTEGLAKLWKDFDTDPKMRVCIFTAVGDRAFCSGVDVKEQAERMAQAAREGGPPPPSGGGSMMATAWQNKVSKPVITAVNGVCGGGALMFVADSDFCIASPNASFFNPGVTVGIVAMVGQVTWTKSVPFQSIMRMAMMGAGERIDAQRAYELGIVTEVVHDKPLIDRAMELADIMRGNSPTAMRIAKKVLWASLEKGLTESQRQQVEISREFTGHPDQREGPRAFAEKRKPVWQDS